MDFIEGMPMYEGHDMILVVVCHLTKMALFIHTFHDIDAEDYLASSCHRSLQSMGPQPTSSLIGAALHLAFFAVTLSVVKHQS